MPDIRLDKKTGKYVVQFQQSGERVHKTLRAGTTKAQALKWAHDKKTEIYKRLTLGHRREHTIVEGVMRYLKEFRGKSARATEDHAAALHPFIMKAVRGGEPRARLFSEVPDVVKEMHQVYDEGELSGSTINRRLAILRRVVQLAADPEEWNWIERAVKVKLLPENPSRHVYLTRPELAALLWRIKNKEYRRLCLAAAFTGLRRGELFALEPEDIRGNVIVLVEKDGMSIKNGKARVVPIFEQVRFIFRRLPFVLTDRLGLSKAVRKASGGKVRFHDLRHTAASFLINSGSRITEVKEFLGHSSIVTTQRYAHLDGANLVAAVNRMRIPHKSPTGAASPADTTTQRLVSSGK